MPEKCSPPSMSCPKLQRSYSRKQILMSAFPKAIKSRLPYMNNPLVICLHKVGYHTKKKNLENTARLSYLIQFITKVYYFFAKFALKPQHGALSDHGSFSECHQDNKIDQKCQYLALVYHTKNTMSWHSLSCTYMYQYMIKKKI